MSKGSELALCNHESTNIPLPLPSRLYFQKQIIPLLWSLEVWLVYFFYHNFTPPELSFFQIKHHMS